MAFKHPQRSPQRTWNPSCLERVLIIKCFCTALPLWRQYPDCFVGLRFGFTFASVVWPLSHFQKWPKWPLWYVSRINDRQSPVTPLLGEGEAQKPLLNFTYHGLNSPVQIFCKLPVKLSPLNHQLRDRMRNFLFPPFQCDDEWGFLSAVFWLFLVSGGS